MSGGEQQMLAIGRALMADPKLLLLDEPSMGIAPILVERIYETIAEINKQGTTILLVEQNANFALEREQPRLRPRDRHGRPHRRRRRAAGQPRGAEGVPGRMTLFALLGSTALWLLYAWLFSAIVAQWLSERKGYGEKAGLVTGMLLSALAIPIWLLMPPRRDSRWKLQGPFGRGDGRTVAQLRAERDQAEGGG